MSAVSSLADTALPPVLPFEQAAVRELIQRWREDPGGTYRTWFLWEQRLKNFRSLRRGIQVVSAEIEDDAFGSAYRGSSLETVVHGIAEQRQIFKEADHAFLWKPKLRIPDIYEDRANQLAFGRLLETCRCCTTEQQLLSAIRSFAALNVKGLGPAAANLLYFLHPTLMPPFNTAIVRGYNTLTGERIKLGSWSEYLHMRAGVLLLNEQFQGLLSNDLGAVAGFLFDIGTERYALPPVATADTAETRAAWRAALKEAVSQAALKPEVGAADDVTHAQVQGWLRDLGKGLGFDPWIASNDRNRPYDGGRLGDGTLARLPESVAASPAADAIGLIDVLWFERGPGTVAAAFEVEHTTSIYSGIVRMLDLAMSVEHASMSQLYLVAPDARREDVRAQLRRPAFASVADLDVKYLPYSELEQHRSSAARFGTGMHPIGAMAQSLR